MRIMGKSRSQPDGNGDGFGAIFGAELLHDVLDVPFDGFFRDEELIGDVDVAVAACDFAQDIDFAPAQSLLAEVFGEGGGDFGGDHGLAGMDPADDVNNRFAGHVLEEVATGSGGHGALDFGVTLAEGTPAEIQAHDDVIRAYLGTSSVTS